MFASLRMLAFVRRGVRALESLAESQRELAMAARNRRLQSEARRARKPHATQFDTLDITAAEDRYKKSRPDAQWSEDAP
jgi:hypothetical protein